MTPLDAQNARRDAHGGLPAPLAALVRAAAWLATRPLALRLALAAWARWIGGRFRHGLSVRDQRRLARAHQQLAAQVGMPAAGRVLGDLTAEVGSRQLDQPDFVQLLQRAVALTAPPRRYHHRRLLAALRLEADRIAFTRRGISHAAPES